MDVVVTGAGGFSGSHIVKALVARGHHVCAVAGRTLGRLDVSMSGITAVTGDLTDELPLPQRVDAVIHAAARSPAPGVTDEDMRHANVDGTARMIAYAEQANASTFIYLSSLSIYGDIKGPVVDETTPISNPNVYGATKYHAEEMLRREPSLRSLSIRLPGVIGPGSVRNWLTGVLETAKAGRDITFFNPTASFNNALHIIDLCDMIGAIIEREDWPGHHVVTVGAAGTTTVQRAIEIIVEAAGSRSKLTPRAEQRASFIISSERAVREFGYRPMPIEDMLRRFAAENTP